MPNTVSSAEVAAFINAAIKKRGAHLRLTLEPTIHNLLKHHNVREGYTLSTQALNEAVYNCAKDLEKLSIYQQEQVDPVKTFGYFGFWIRKIKPVENAFYADGRAFKEVNEYLSIWLIAAFVTRFFTAHKDPAKRAMAKTVFHRLNNLLNDKSRMDYLVHCLRVRSFAPHHFVLLLHQMILGV